MSEGVIFAAGMIIGALMAWSFTAVFAIYHIRQFKRSMK
jgi:hypothetical protein